MSLEGCYGHVLSCTDEGEQTFPRMTFIPINFSSFAAAAAAAAAMPSRPL